MMAVLSFRMPGESRASLCVAARVLVRAPGVRLHWYDGSRGAVVLYVECEDDEVEVVRRLVLGSHRDVVDTTDRAEGRAARPGHRRAVGRRRR